MVAYPDRGAGNDPKLLNFFLGGVASLSPPRLNMGVMICLGQGGLRSLSASSFCSLLKLVHFFCVLWSQYYGYFWFKFDLEI